MQPKTYGNSLPPVGAERKMGPKRIIKIVLMSVAFAALVWLGILSLQEYRKPRNLADIPLIEADKSAFKMVPEDPGGMEIPNQDKQVFDTIATSDAEAVEKEAPKPAATPSSDPVQLPVPTPEERVLEQVNQALQPEKNSVLQAAEEEMKQASAPEPVSAEEETAPAPEPEPAVSLEGKFVIQLGSFRSQEGAESGWKTLLIDYPDVLSDLTHEIRSVRLGSKGQFFRLFAGPFGSRGAASDYCEQLTAQQQGCFVSSL